MQLLLNVNKSHDMYVEGCDRRKGQKKESVGVCLECAEGMLSRRLRSQETMEPMIPGRAAAALPASFARVRPRAFSGVFSPTL